MDDRVRAAIRRVIKAIEDEGCMPSYHRKVMRKHRSEWPTLWRALDDLRRSMKGDE